MTETGLSGEGGQERPWQKAPRSTPEMKLTARSHDCLGGLKREGGIPRRQEVHRGGQAVAQSSLIASALTNAAARLACYYQLWGIMPVAAVSLAIGRPSLS